jgi:hypothetical protein
MLHTPMPEEIDGNEMEEPWGPSYHYQITFV